MKPTDATRATAQAMPEINRRRAQAANLLTKVQARIDGHISTVQVLTNVVCEALTELHGGTWSVNIDHEGEFVVIRRRRDNFIEKSQLRGLV